MKIRKRGRPSDEWPDATTAEQERVRAFIRALMCPVCHRGPFRTLAVHTSSAHGIKARELRESAGLLANSRICSQELSDKIREMCVADGRVPPSTAGQRTSSPRRTSAGREILATAGRGSITRAIEASLAPEVRAKIAANPQFREGALRGARTRGIALRRLTESDVREIRQLGSRYGQSELGRRFGVSPSAIRDILSGHTWRDLP